MAGSPSIEQLFSKSCVKLGVAVEECADEVIEAWLALCASEHPKSSETSKNTMQDELRELLAVMAKSLCEPETRTEVEKLAISHGKQRWQAGWKVQEVVQDYQLLRRALISSLDSSASLSTHEMLMLSFLLDLSVRASVFSFHEYTLQREQDLQRELRHRLGNTVELARAVASQTIYFSASLEEAARAVNKRLLALGEAQRLTLEKGGENVSMQEMTDTVFKPFGRDRLEVQGSELILSVTVGSTLYLILNELAANAVKYGALSTSSGRVELSWKENDDRLRLRWKETGGPQVHEPTEKGFGSRLIETLVRELEGRIEFDFAHSGLTVQLDIPSLG